MNSEAFNKADNSKYANGKHIRLVNSAPIAFFSNFKLTTSNGKNSEVISHAHIVSLRYKLVNISKDGEDLSFGFHRDQIRRRDELTKKNLKRKYHLRILLNDVFRFAELQEKPTHGLG